jgi:hypothetical protein
VWHFPENQRLEDQVTISRRDIGKKEGNKALGERGAIRNGR